LGDVPWTGYVPLFYREGFDCRHADSPSRWQPFRRVRFGLDGVEVCAGGRDAGVTETVGYGDQIDADGEEGSAAAGAGYWVIPGEPIGLEF
jgi:hypothetical protein